MQISSGASNSEKKSFYPNIQYALSRIFHYQNVTFIQAQWIKFIQIKIPFQCMMPNNSKVFIIKIKFFSSFHERIVRTNSYAHFKNITRNCFWNLYQVSQNGFYVRSEDVGEEWHVENQRTFSLVVFGMGMKYMIWKNIKAG